MRTNPALTARCEESESQRLCIWGRTRSEQQVLSRRTATGEMTRVADGCYARADQWSRLDPVERYRRIVRTMAALHPDWIFGDMTAAAMHGINDSIRYLDEIHLMTDRRRHSRDHGRLRYHLLPDDELHGYQVVDGVRTTPIGRTVFDCARRLDFPDGLSVAEAALRQGLMTRERMMDLCRELPGYRRDKALRAVRLAPAGTENGGEAYSYAVMLDEGFVPPLVQEEIIDPLDLSRRYRVDFSWHTEDGRFIVAELDGRAKYTDPEMFRNGSLSETIIAEKEREERIRLVADEVVRFSFSEAYRRHVLVAKLEAARVPRVQASWTRDS
ncbi:hypothetical protein JS533_002700 [Bifidobacterium amazonense]|uniref:CTP synthase n=1 Tax=Bifidobacterium amazonense TaxID=2809027 RepID=A0ABS9VSZ8_9BIFI|nr:hypothetical protein [Bifidobacterium amazonense]MCH9275188.1 hypothetical protein [Bifidobacterium amazonense]